MLTETEYLIAWAVYFFAAIGVVVAVWRAFGFLGFAVTKKVLSVLTFTLLLTPWSVSVGADRLAPALFVGIFDATLQQDAAMYRAFFPLSLALMAAVLLLCLEHVISARKA